MSGRRIVPEDAGVNGKNYRVLGVCVLEHFERADTVNDKACLHF